MRIERLVLATHNRGKLREFAALLAPYGLELLGAGELGLQPPPETGTSFAANARLKARFVAEAAQLPALADDSGLCASALEGAPGVYSADWAGEPADFQQAMLRVARELAALDKPGHAASRAAHFATVLALALPGEEEILLSEGRVAGELVYPPRGLQGFGYDPMFVPEGEARTFGEMGGEEKQALSHRARAVEGLLEKLAARNWLPEAA